MENRKLLVCSKCHQSIDNIGLCWVHQEDCDWELVDASGCFNKAQPIKSETPTSNE